MGRKSPKHPRPRRERLSSTVLALAGLALIVLAVFSASLHSEFVYDSQGEIVDWDFIHHPGNLLTPLTFRLMGLDMLDFNRPVAVTSLMFDAVLWGPNPLGYHLTNILLHVATTCLVFLLIRQVLTFAARGRDHPYRTGIAFLATLIFALHPLVTEAVCEPANRKDLLAALFGLTALLVAARHRPQGGPGDVLRLFLCPLLCLLAVGSKEVGIVYPLLLGLYWVLFRWKEPRKFWAIAMLGSCAVVLVFLIARFALEHHPSEIFLHPPGYVDGSLLGALLVDPCIFALYLSNLFWPAYLCADYTGYSVRFLPLALALPVVILVAALLGWWAVKDRRALFAVAIIALGLLPVANLMPLYHPAADRYLYNPLVGLALLVALALDADWLAISPKRQALAALFVVLIAGLLIPVTLRREKVWSSELALWQDTLRRNPTSFPAQVSLPEILLKVGRVEEAKADTEKALRGSLSHWPWAWVDYALELNRLGDFAGAEKAARRAIALKPDIVDADKMVRTLQASRGQMDEFAPLAAAASGRPSPP